MYHAAFKSLGHLAGALSSTDALSLEYSSHDLRLSSGSLDRHYLLMQPTAHLKVSLAAPILVDLVKEAMFKLTDLNVAQTLAPV